MEKFEFLRAVGIKVRTRRKALKMTQGALAAKLDLKSSAFICEVEKGRRLMSAHMLYKIHAELGGIFCLLEEP